jgi:hypothetical protein
MSFNNDFFCFQDYFDAKGKTPFEAWPKDLVQHLDEGKARSSSIKSNVNLCLITLLNVTIIIIIK